MKPWPRLRNSFVRGDHAPRISTLILILFSCGLRAFLSHKRLPTEAYPDFPLMRSVLFCG